MNKTDRLLAIVLELQGKGRQRAEDLAKTFETSKRTIYRDIEALCEAGVPLVSIPGRGYSLMEGYFLPPLSFSTDEATMLLLGSAIMAQSFDAQYRTAAHDASRKITGVLPEGLRQEVAYLQKNIVFITPTQRAAEVVLLQQIRRAIIECMTLRFTYTKRHSQNGQETDTRREADPYSIVHVTGSWYMTAYCHKRNAVRIFRLDRMGELEVLSQTFTRRNENAVQEHQNQQRPCTIRLLFDAEVTRWVHESRNYFIVSEEEVPAGLLLTLQVRQEQDVVHWILGWGSHVKVLEPDSLRHTLAQEAHKMTKLYE